MFDLALKDLQRWEPLGLGLHLNVSAFSLTKPGFVTEMAERLRRYPRITPERVTLEILETAALGDLDLVTQVIAEGRELGLRFALDDFGTGYSSLTYFRHLPAHTLKIDQSFVRDMLHDQDDLRIVEAVVGLAEAFSREVVAEGIESVAHGSLLLRFGCELGQGYGITRPMPAAAVAGWVGAYRAPTPWQEASTQPWPKDDLSLLLVEVEHAAWIEAVLDRLGGDRSARAGEGEIPPCAFGEWHQGEGRWRYGRFESFDSLRALHDEAHRLAQALLHGGGRDGPPTEMEVAALKKASDALLIQLRRLQQMALDPDYRALLGG